MLLLFRTLRYNSHRNKFTGKDRPHMPVIYYAYYSPVSERISDISTQEHLLGRQLLSQGLRELYHISVSASQVDAMLRTEKNGKPCLSDHPDIFFNITHCRGLAACAFGHSPLGIDAELPGYPEEVVTFSPGIAP